MYFYFSLSNQDCGDGGRAEEGKEGVVGEGDGDGRDGIGEGPVVEQVSIAITCNNLQYLPSHFMVRFFPNQKVPDATGAGDGGAGG